MAPRKNSLKTIIMAGLILLAWFIPYLVFASGPTVDPFEATYRVTFEANWTAASLQEGASLPGNAHFSPLIGGVHNEEVMFWAPGQLASLGIENMAELGLTAQLTNEVNNEINENPPDALAVIARPGSIDNTETVIIPSITVNQDFPLVTLVSMVAPSHDWFIGVQNLALRQNGQWLESKVVNLFPYDAGTEEGTDFSLTPSIDTDPPAPITSISGVFPFASAPLGTFTFTRINFSNVHLNKTVEPETKTALQGLVTYTLVLSNSGDIDASNTVLTDTLPLSTAFAGWVERPAGANESSNQITWTGSVTQAATITFTFVASYTVTSYGETITNVARFWHPTGASGQSSASFTVQPSSGSMIYLPVVLK